MTYPNFDLIEYKFKDKVNEEGWVKNIMYDIDFIGVEIDEQYYQLSKQRMEEYIIDNEK